MKLIPPHQLQKILDNDLEYQQAKKLLWLNWDEDPNMLYHQMIEPDVVALARSLQSTGLINGRVNLADYRSVSQLVGQHDHWFSSNAKKELLKPFE
ncbi:MAG: hypothetical protein SO061_06550 [Limosilactobacillus coleohominis]|jgi:hypothetical protein|uniref:hypothetical protein n=1 Tax=Limosilactobacillus coleohominis TaxID=181675 RepID=UPI0015BA6FB5|nr:hypothetical protein [Limosilactobacillus coleohominis]MCI5812960.1 hypothetical protein [Lactobacillus sp.]MDY3703199.1 hypothetical protein [Limosilactobacillus coleohominis]MDY5628965.1 hypothetical protein [Limosilactobacillus coleohominis]